MSMELLKGILAIDLFLYIKKHRAFVISDLHAGFEESLVKQGMFIPRHNLSDLKLRLEKAFNYLDSQGMALESIIINGDIVHSFSMISRDEKDSLIQTIRFLEKHAPLTLIKGNHDKVVEKLIERKLSGEAVLGDILITHGDKINPLSDDKRIKTIIIGHEHPSVALSSGARIEKFKCFLAGKYAGKNLLMMPSSNILIEGTDVLRERLQSPYIRSVRDFDVYVVEDQIYDFGKVRALMAKMRL